MTNLPKLPASLLPPEPKPTEKKIQAMRMSVLLQQLHDTATDRGLPDEERTQAAHTLAMALNNHFDLVVWALRVAGGARKP